MEIHDRSSNVNEMPISLITEIISKTYVKKVSNENEIVVNDGNLNEIEFINARK